MHIYAPCEFTFSDKKRFHMGCPVVKPERAEFPICLFICGSLPQYQHCRPHIDFLLLELCILELSVSQTQCCLKGTVVDNMVFNWSKNLCT